MAADPMAVAAGGASTATASPGRLPRAGSSGRCRWRVFARTEGHDCGAMSPFADVLRAPRLDRALASGADPASEPILGARARRLTSWRTRRRIARALEEVESDGPGVPVRRDSV